MHHLQIPVNTQNDPLPLAVHLSYGFWVYYFSQQLQDRNLSNFCGTGADYLKISYVSRTNTLFCYVLKKTLKSFLKYGQAFTPDVLHPDIIE